MKKVVEFLPLLTICFLFFGFVNLYYYYQVFNIEIYSYVSTTDIVVSFLPNVVVVAVLFSSLFINQIIKQVEVIIPLSREEEEKEWKRNEKKINWWKKNSAGIILIYLGIYFVILLLLKPIFHLKPYDILEWEYVGDFIFLVLIYVALLVHKKLSFLVDKPFQMLFLVIFLGIRMGHYSTLRGLAIKDGQTKDKKTQLKFNYKGQLQNTSDTVVYIGKTATYLFLYRMKDSSSMVYPLAQVDDLIIK